MNKSLLKQQASFRTVVWHESFSVTCAVLLSRVWLFATPWTVAHQAPLSLRFPRQEYLRELPFPSPGDVPNPGIERTSPALAGGFFTIWATREALKSARLLFNSSNSHTVWEIRGKGRWVSHLSAPRISWECRRNPQRAEPDHTMLLSSFCFLKKLLEKFRGL